MTDYKKKILADANRIANTNWENQYTADSQWIEIHDLKQLLDNLPSEKEIIEKAIDEYLEYREATTPLPTSAEVGLDMMKYWLDEEKL